MNPEGEQADLLSKSAKSDTSTSINGTLSAPPTLESEAYSNGTSSTSPQQHKDWLQHQNSHQEDSPKGIYIINS